MNPERFTELLASFGGKRIAVVGDFILDKYLIGDTRRVSREAPVVVIDYRTSVHHPGGAANAAQNVSSLGGSASAVGIVGSDEDAAVLVRLLEEKQVDTSSLLEHGTVSTAVKMRIIAGELHAQKQQVARIDHSYRVENASKAIADLNGTLEQVLVTCDAVLISDYGMGIVPGALSESVIEHGREKGIPVVVDSRFSLLRFGGATAATPNEIEVFQALKLEDDEKAALPVLVEQILSRTSLGGLIVTRGNMGMYVHGSGGEIGTVGIVGNRDATDVTGAGDTVAAAVTLSLSCGATLMEAAEIATYAAAVVVMKRGTATVTQEELKALRERHPNPEKTGE
jgi:rfaE bifunctional protein kinase chain/domain